MKVHLKSEDETTARVSLAGVVAEGTPAEDPLSLIGVSGLYGRNVIFDMSDVEMLNSHGIGWLLRTHSRCGDAGGRLVLHSIPQTALNVLKIMRLHQVLHLADDEQRANELLEANQQ